MVNVYVNIQHTLMVSGMESGARERWEGREEREGGEVMRRWRGRRGQEREGWRGQEEMERWEGGSRMEVGKRNKRGERSVENGGERGGEKGEGEGEGGGEAVRRGNGDRREKGWVRGERRESMPMKFPGPVSHQHYSR